MKSMTRYEPVLSLTQEQLFSETLEAAMEMPQDLNFKGPPGKSQE